MEEKATGGRNIKKRDRFRGSGNPGTKWELPKSQAELDLGKEIKTNSTRSFSHRGKKGIKKEKVKLLYCGDWIGIKVNLCVDLKSKNPFASINNFQ